MIIIHFDLHNSLVEKKNIYINKIKSEKNSRKPNSTPFYSSFLEGSFGVLIGDHLRSNLGIISGLGIIYGWGSFAALYSVKLPFVAKNSKHLVGTSGDDSSALTVGHVRYINILTWLRGFQVNFLYLVLFPLYLSLLWELRNNRNLKNLQF